VIIINQSISQSANQPSNFIKDSTNQWGTDPVMWREPEA